MFVIYKSVACTSPAREVVRALVVAYAFMGLGGEVLQLSVHGNVFWMTVGLCAAMSFRDREKQLAPAGAIAPPGPRFVPAKLQPGMASSTSAHR